MQQTDKPKTFKGDVFDTQEHYSLTQDIITNLFLYRNAKERGDTSGAKLHLLYCYNTFFQHEFLFHRLRSELS